MHATARIGVLAVSFLLLGCGSAVPPDAPITASPQKSTSSQEPVRSTVSMGAISSSTCREPLTSTPPTHYAFQTVTIPPGDDLCQDVGSFGDPAPLQLSNDGTLVAFNARDFSHETSLWLGDLRAGPIGVAYVAPEASGKKEEIWWPQLGAGQLFWIEYAHSGADVNTDLTKWTVRRMDLATRVVSVVAEDSMPAIGGKKYVSQIRWDGHTLAAAEELPDGSWQIELWDAAGHVQQTIPVDRVLYDLALADGGIIYSTGVSDTAHDSIGHMRLFYWTASAGSTLIGTDGFDVAGCSDLVAWQSDPGASRGSTGSPVSQRVYVASAPFVKSEPESPIPSADGDPGIDSIACGSGTVFWWEVEGGRATGRDVLTAWQRGWSAPVQIKTEGNSADISVRDGWVVWFEYDANMENGRLRASPMSVLPSSPS